MAVEGLGLWDGLETLPTFPLHIHTITLTKNYITDLVPWKSCALIIMLFVPQCCIVRVEILQIPVISAGTSHFAPHPIPKSGDCYE